MDDNRIATIEVVDAFITDHDDTSRDVLDGSEWTMVEVEVLIRQLKQIQLSGCRAVVLVVRSGGGSTRAGARFYNALQRFRAAGGRVVAHLEIAASTMAYVPLCADYLTASPDALIWVHGSRGDVPGRSQPTTEITKSAGWTIMSTGTLIPHEQLKSWIGRPSTLADPGGFRFGSAVGFELGFIDEVASKSRAEEVASAFARGEAIHSPRLASLRARADQEARR